MRENDAPGLRGALQRALDKALSVQENSVAQHVDRLRKKRPDATPAELIGVLEKQYLAAVTAAGAGVGGSAALPGVGTGVALALSAGETVTFLETSALFCLAVGHVHGESVEDLERRRTLLLAVLLGDSGASFMEKAAGRTGKHWGKLVTKKIPIGKITSANKVLGRWFITKYGVKRGILVIGRVAPLGIGAAIGGIGNAVSGRTVIAGARRAFGPAPNEFFPGTDDDPGGCPVVPLIPGAPPDQVGDLQQAGEKIKDVFQS